MILHNYLWTVPWHKKGANPSIWYPLIFDRGVWNTFGTNKCKEFTPYAWTSANLFSFLKPFSRRFYQENKSVSSIYVFYVYILRHNYRFQIRCKDTTFIWINQRLFWNCSFQLIGTVATVEGERAELFRVTYSPWKTHCRRAFYPSFSLPFV